MELLLARIAANWCRAHTAKDQASPSVRDFLPYLNPWPVPGSYSDIDREVMAAFGVRKQ